jgi:spore germination cell wall hydrolase CwlJ-like protein
MFKKFVIGFLLAVYASSFSFVHPDFFHQQQAKAKEKHCIVEVLWYEARSESEAGIRAVASVLLNRLHSQSYPDSFCAIIQQRKQFSYRNKLKNPRELLKIKPVVSEQDKYKLVHKISVEIVEGKFTNVFDRSVLWYHTLKVNPSWSKKMQRVKIYGQHVFLRQR